MELLLKELMAQYDLLLKYYEEMYQKFLKADCTKVDEYLKTIGNTSYYITMISAVQSKIEAYRNKLKTDINNDLLIDSMIDMYSDGRFSLVTDKIEHIVESLRKYEEKAKNVLNKEMNKIQYGLDEIGLDEKYVKLISKLSSSQENMKN